MSFSQFIIDNIDLLLEDWVDFASKQFPAANSMGLEALRDHARMMLLAIATDMQTYQSALDQKDKSVGKRPTHAPNITESAREHAIQRFSSGFTLKQLIAEYRALRASTIRHRFHEGDPVSAEELKQLVRFGEAVDQCLLEAAELYNERLVEAGEIFVGIIGHDLRNPLNAAVAGNALQALLGDSSGQRGSANERVAKSLQLITEMINGLADFSRTRVGGRLLISPSPMSLEKLCQETVALFSDSHPQRNIQFEADGILTGYWDAKRLKQLLGNLIANALSYGYRESTVTVQAREDGDQVVLSVHNEGPPIPPEVLPNLFDPMVRGDTSSGSGIRGAESLGLGLYIVKAVAQAHVGTVDVDSSEANGTTFSVRLPRKAPE